MRSNKLPWFFMAGVLVLQQGLHWLDSHLDTRVVQRGLIETQEIEPAALFYSELATARRAESRVRSALQAKVP